MKMTSQPDHLRTQAVTKPSVANPSGQTSLMTLAAAQLGRDLKNATRSGGGWFHGVFFFTVFSGFTAFAVGPDRVQLAAAAPALLWLGAMLALQLSANDLYAPDFSDGFLRVLAAEQPSLGPYFVGKLAVMGLTAGAPIIVLAPVYYILFALPPPSALLAGTIFLIGAPALVLAAAATSALSAAMRVSGLLGMALSTPIIVPILIFGVGASERALEGQVLFSPELQILCALTLLYAVILPPFALVALRLGLE